MRIYLTSVEESQKAEQIQHLVKSLFPNYSVVIIPSKYATEKGKQEVREYSKQYYQKNAEKQKQQRRERYYRQKAEKVQGKSKEKQVLDTSNNKKNEINKNDRNKER